MCSVFIPFERGVKENFRLWDSRPALACTLRRFSVMAKTSTDNSLCSSIYRSHARRKCHSIQKKSWCLLNLPSRPIVVIHISEALHLSSECFLIRYVLSFLTYVRAHFILAHNPANACKQLWIYDFKLDLLVL